MSVSHLSPSILLLLILVAPALSAEPEKQTEKDWVDGRWGQTEIGQFLASTIQLPNGNIAKGLTVRVGNANEASVCYDTRAGLLRAGWMGFLKPDPARFGLIRPPKVASEPKFLAVLRRGPEDSAFAYKGLRLNGQRVMLLWEAGNTVVHESPFYEKDTGLFSRAFEVQPGDEVRMSLFEAKSGSPAMQKYSGYPGALVETEDCTVFLAWVGDSNTEINRSGPVVYLKFPARQQNVTGKLVIWPGSANDLAAFEKALQKVESTTDLKSLAVAGPGRWSPEILTHGQKGLNTDILAVDTLTVPYENLWKALMFLSGVDFLSNGIAFVSAIHGDVWRVSGIDDSLREIRWKRFATGLFQPLGLRIVNGRLFVLGRDQITELVDENNDGEADLYRNFCNLIETSSGGHDYVTCLEVDDAGNFYYVDPRGIHRVSPDGKRKETLATGWRNPNGLGIGPRGVITVAPQQGEWTPSSAIYEVKTGSYYGFGGPRIATDRPLGYDPPLCWIPHSADNSSGSQVWVPEDRWGVLSGQMLHLVWGCCSMMLVLRDERSEPTHGAVLPLPGRFLSGPMRGTFSPHDGHLYVAGCTGWQTSAARDGSLQRVRYTGKTIYLPTAFHVETNGITLRFSQPLKADTAEDTGSYAVGQWNYKYTKEYGSADWCVADPTKKGRDPVEVRSARLARDSNEVFLEIPTLRPVMQMEVKYHLDAIDGHKLRGTVHTTIHERQVVHSASAR
jgi:hypothetical protein